MYYVYFLKSEKANWVYVGYTNNLRRRFAEHNRGEVVSTRLYRPFELVYYESYKEKKCATKREYEFKHNSQQKEFVLKRLGLKK